MTPPSRLAFKNQNLAIAADASSYGYRHICGELFVGVPADPIVNSVIDFGTTAIVFRNRVFFEELSGLAGVISCLDPVQTGFNHKAAGYLCNPVIIPTSLDKIRRGSTKAAFFLRSARYGNSPQVAFATIAVFTQTKA